MDSAASAVASAAMSTGKGERCGNESADKQNKDNQQNHTTARGAVIHAVVRSLSRICKPPVSARRFEAY